MTMKYIHEARLIPMSLDDEEFKGKSIKEIQKEFFINSLKNQGNNYRYKSRGLVANDGDLVLFQMNNSVVASAIFKERIQYNLIMDSYHGELVFYKDTIKICNPITSEELKKYCPDFDKFSQMMQFVEIADFEGLNKRLRNSTDDYSYENRKRIKTKKDWLDILNNEEQENNVVIDTLIYMMGCKDHTSNGKNIARAFNTTKIPILDFVHFGERIIKLKGIDEQFGDRGKNRYWNIPFVTVPEKNKNGIFTWKIRDELAEALIEKYNLTDSQTTIEELFKDFKNHISEENYAEEISDDLKIREEFVRRFNVNTIINMNLNDYVTGRSLIDDVGRNSFCYLLEFKMMQLGDMRGATAEKFGVYCAKETGEYVFTNKYGNTLNEAFNKVKSEICKLLVAGNQDNYEEMNNSMLPPLFKGKILSTYYPQKYLCIFKEEDVDKILNLLDIDINGAKTLEQKKKLLKDYKDNSLIFKNCSDYYFVWFIYYSFNDELKEKHTVNGEIDYNLELVDFNYLGNHIVQKKNTFISRETDYERINRNKKDIGNRGEKAVLNYEKNNLIKLGKFDLAEMVEISENDAIGYDILSYSEDGTEKHIEVKTNSGNSNKLLDFYLTDNELEKMLSDPDYYLYYLYSIKSKPKLHIINKTALLNNSNYLKPVLYKIAIDVEYKEKI